MTGDQGGRDTGGEKGVESGSILKVHSMEFSEELDMERERKRRVKESSRTSTSACFGANPTKLPDLFSKTSLPKPLLPHFRHL